MTRTLTWAVEMSLEALRKEVLNCNKCGLAKTRNHVIFGEGNSHAPILIIGEAPGRDEDLQGRLVTGYPIRKKSKNASHCY